MSDLGDLTDFIKEGSLANLDWLNVDEKAYRELETLPKQNLDTSPDLEALWQHQDGSPSRLIPNTGEPRTMGDMSETHGRLRSAPEDLIRTARLALVQTSDPQKISHILRSRFDSTTLAMSKTALAQVLTERGLLGRLYIAASDFPNCPASAEFVRRYAFEARYVLAKQACGDCANKHKHPNGGHHCGVFHKEIKVDVPYSEALATEVEKLEAAKGKAIQASTQEPRDRIRNAYLAQVPEGRTFTGHTQVAPPKVVVDSQQVLITAENLTKQRQAREAAAMAEVKAKPIMALLRRELIKGRAPEAVLKALKLAFDVRDLQATQAVWSPLFKQAGLYGALYLTQDSFDDCREGAEFAHKHGSRARVVVAGEKCAGCSFNQASMCLLYAKKLVASISDIVTAGTVQAVIEEGCTAGNLPRDAASRSWGSSPAESLKALHRVASTGLKKCADVRGLVEQGFYGTHQATKTGDLTKRRLLQVTARYLNEGLYGEDLKRALQGQFESRDIAASSKELRLLLAEQGLQGIKYIDPTIYTDYGRGCAEAARLHRSRFAVRYAKLGPKCGTCVHQEAHPGTCSVLNKQLVTEPPYVDKVAEQQAILASGKATEVSYASLVNNGLTMMQEYQLQEQGMPVELAPVTASDDTWVSLTNHQEFKL